MGRWGIVAFGLAGCSGPPPNAETGEAAGGSETGSTSVDSTSSSTDPPTTSSMSTSESSGGSESSGASESSDASESSGGLEPCELQRSGPVTVEADGQVIEFLHIVAPSGPGITIEGYTDVVVRNVWIEHAGGPGITIFDSDGVTIEDVVIEHTGSPPEGENPSDELNNIVCVESVGPTVRNVRLARGSSGIYLVECPDATLSFIEGHDFRGPFPRGQLVQFNNSDGGVLEDFSVVNPPESWPEDNVNVYQSLDIEIRRGLVDGNNSPSGQGVIFDGDNSLGIVEDVDAIRMGNGCFSDYAGSDGVVFRRTRCRENICTDQGRGLPSSGALMWSGNEMHTEIRIEDSVYFAPCDPENIVWPTESFVVLDLVEEDFVIREPLALEFCWE